MGTGCAGANRVLWSTAIQPYTGDVKVYVCPSASAIALIPAALPTAGTTAGNDFDRVWGHRLN